MRRTKVIIASVLGLGTMALGLAARELLSFQVDAAGLKGMAHALISQAAIEHAIGPESRGKLIQIADLAIDGATPHVVQLRADLDALARARDGDGASAAPVAPARSGSGIAAGVSSDLKARLDDVERDLVGLVDAKDAALVQARTRLSPDERAQLIVTVTTAMRKRTGLDETSLEEVLSGLRAAREARLVALLGLDAEHAAKVKGTMAREAARAKEVRHERWAALAGLQTAVAAPAGRLSLDAALARWDACTAHASNLIRERIDAMRSVLTVDQQVRLALAAHDRIERALRLASLIQRFHPLL